MKYNVNDIVYIIPGYAEDICEQRWNATPIDNIFVIREIKNNNYIGNLPVQKDGDELYSSSFTVSENEIVGHVQDDTEIMYRNEFYIGKPAKGIIKNNKVINVDTGKKEQRFVSSLRVWRLDDKMTLPRNNEFLMANDDLARDMINDIFNSIGE